MIFSRARRRGRRAAAKLPGSWISRGITPRGYRASSASGAVGSPWAEHRAAMRAPLTRISRCPRQCGRIISRAGQSPGADAPRRRLPLKQFNCNSGGVRLSRPHAGSPDDSPPAELRPRGHRRAQDAASRPERRAWPMLRGSSGDLRRALLRRALHARGIRARSPALRRSAYRLRFGLRVAGDAVVLRARRSSRGIRLSAAPALVDPSSVHPLRWPAVRVTLPRRPVCVVVGPCVRGAVGWFRRGRRPLREWEV